jgi:hypothetical protein
MLHMATEVLWMASFIFLVGILGAAYELNATNKDKKE